MFEAFVLVCLVGTTNVCHTLEDLEGAYEIAVELPSYMPNYYALKYKCMLEEGKVKTTWQKKQKSLEKQENLRSVED